MWLSEFTDRDEGVTIGFHHRRIGGLFESRSKNLVVFEGEFHGFSGVF